MRGLRFGMTVRTLFIRSLILAAKFFFASLIVFCSSKIYYIGRQVLEKSSVSKLLVWMLGGQLRCYMAKNPAMSMIISRESCRARMADTWSKTKANERGQKRIWKSKPSADYKIKVYYENIGNTLLPLHPLIKFNRIYRYTRRWFNLWVSCSAHFIHSELQWQIMVSRYVWAENSALKINHLGKVIRLVQVFWYSSKLRLEAQSRISSSFFSFSNDDLSFFSISAFSFDFTRFI